MPRNVHYYEVTEWSFQLDPKHIGANFNEWVKPVANFDGCDQGWIKSLKESELIGT